MRWGAAAVLLAATLPALAGNQKEEALADSVRLALANAIRDAAPPQPSFRTEAERQRYQQWLEQMSARLQRRLPDQQTRTEFLATVWYEARRAGLDPAMVLGLIQVESAYRKYAVSMVGARGYMQVMPFWTSVIGDHNRSALFNMQTNLRYGCAILRMYLDMEAGNLFLALGRYNGSRGKSDYPNAVLAAWNHWKLPAEIGNAIAPRMAVGSAR
ncbi:transglycosylase SLT domain-containing protein [Pseudoduganella sp. FT93W]|uniref:Transglycosylase SLT domain-containing protein n=1 Tax=Duganella fentianensis TaxID=2692177 RepID=A0A845HS33_9BURK|nr:transglycosylase SLT domain-containing protein [Duganella fentianensis]